MTFIFAAALSLLCVAIILISPRVGIVFLFIIKPIVDSTWNDHMGGINALKILGALVPAVLFLRFIFTSDLRKHGAPFIIIWLIYFLANIICFSLILTKGQVVGSIEFILRIANGLIGFYMLRTYIDNEKWLKVFVIGLLIAGLYPMGMGVYQAATGKIWQLRESVGLIRNVGLYHDSFSLRYLVFQTLVGILLYWSFFKKKSIISSLFLSGYSLVSIFVLFKLYTKAGYAILILWAITWSIFNKKVFQFIVLFMLVLALNLATGSDIYDKFTTVYSKEMSAIEGTGDESRILSGRLYLWEDNWENWKGSGIPGILFGLGTTAGTSHNEFLRVLISSGVFGFTAYMILLFLVSYNVIKNLFRDRNTMSVIAFMVLTGWLVDSIGLVPGLYSSYQWYAWGIIGLNMKPLEYLKRLTHPDLKPSTPATAPLLVKG